MQTRVGFEMSGVCPQPTPMILALSVHHPRAADLVQPDHLLTQPAVPLTANRDPFDNWCHRLVAPQSALIIRSDSVINDTGLADVVLPQLTQAPVQTLPESTLVCLLGSRYGETDLLSQIAWRPFGAGPGGWHWVQAITLCRCMNIPARYCTGYLGDIDGPVGPGPMDFAARFEAFRGDRWSTFDPRNSPPRIGCVLIARGRDACDVALTNAFGPNTLQSFKVWSDAVAPT